MDEADTTVALLERWYSGDRAALERLIELHLAWMRDEVRRRIDVRLRRDVESVDVVQDAMIRVLRYEPRFVPENEAQFRALLARMVLNTLRDRADNVDARSPRAGVQQAIPTDSIGHPGASDTGPGAAAERAEAVALVRRALEKLDPDERRLIELRQDESRSFEELAAELGLESPDAARMRYNRALQKLAIRLHGLKRGPA
jgi:RNA polymerase sigma factor (sigma-70 family)